MIPAKTRHSRWQFEELLHYDILPGVSAKIRRFCIHPLGVMVLAVLIAILCGLIVHPRVFTLAAGLAIVATIGCCWPWLTLRGVSATVAFPVERLREGESLRVEATLVNRFPWPAFGMAIGNLGSSDSVEAADGHDSNDCSRLAVLAVRLGTIPGRSRIIANWAFKPPKRGCYPLEIPRLMTGFPFGIFQAGRAVQVHNRLLVWPRTYPVGPVPAVADADDADGTIPRNRAGNAGEFLGVRPYRRGDSPRRIHWAQSARHDRLVVCEVQSMTRAKILLILDLHPSHHTEGVSGSLEWSIRIAASFAEGWLTQGAEVGVIWDGGAIMPRSGIGQLPQILDALATLPPATRTLSELLRMPAVRDARAAVRVIITTAEAREELPESQVEGFRWALLRREGFQAGSKKENSRPVSRYGPRAWLTFDHADSVPEQLLSGWSEARHGS